MDKNIKPGKARLLQWNEDGKFDDGYHGYSMFIDAMRVIPQSSKLVLGPKTHGYRLEIARSEITA